MKQVNHFFIGLFDQHIVFSYGKSNHMISELKAIKSINSDIIDNYITFLNNNNDDLYSGYTNECDSIIFIHLVDKPTLKSANVLVHEIIHAVKHIFKRIGMEHNEYTDELYAYLCDYIYDFIINS